MNQPQARASVVRLGRKHRLLPPRLSIGSKLIGKSNPRDTPVAEYDRVLRAQPTIFDYPLHQKFISAAAQHRHDFSDTETKIIWAAFDVPEKVTTILYDRLVAGDKEAFSHRWLNAASHWLKEARYWRCIGIERPFYDPTTLRANAWAKNGTDIGNIHFSAAMIDAIRDLERAVRRAAEGLPANYIWDKWGPWGMVDGSRTQMLPRFRHNQYVDPDGYDVSPEDISEFKTHEQLKERYGHIIFPDVTPYQKVFLSSTNGLITFDDFPEELQQQVAALRGMSSEDCVKLSTSDDIRCMIYLSALPTLDESRATATSWSELLEVVRPYRERCDLSVDAARLLSALRTVDETRTFVEEKCGFQDFLMTPDKDSTAALLAMLEDIKSLHDQSWGATLLTALIDRDRASALGEEAFAVYSELTLLDRDHRRRLWTARFSGDVNEEASLDFMLQNFARRADRPTTTNEPGEDFDREQEPIGRKVQRRVLQSDRTFVSAVHEEGALSRLNRFRESVRQRRIKDAFEDIQENQLIRTSQY